MKHWLDKDSVIYHILIDRFASEDGELNNYEKPVFCGGTLRGVMSKLDYLENLGVDALWLSPFIKNPPADDAYHGYHPVDFFTVDPRFGTETDLKELISAAHKRNIRIIADLVVNHVSDKHPYFIEAKNDQTSPYRNWFYFSKLSDRYLSFLRFHELPKLNLDHEPAREHIVEAAKYWLDMGIDGFRLDHVVGQSHDFWRHFRKAVKDHRPDAVLIGEVWFKGIGLLDLRSLNMDHKFINWLTGNASDTHLKAYTKELDGALDFRFQHLIKKHFRAITSHRKTGKLRTKLSRRYDKFPDNYLVPSFLDNHDMNRFLFEAGQDKEALKQAAEIQFALPQPVVIYYGTEAGLTQDESIRPSEEYSDLRARPAMPWSAKAQDRELLDFYKQLIRSRKD